jgi:tetratricopeptide (TPR) repeat protein
MRGFSRRQLQIKKIAAEKIYQDARKYYHKENFIKAIDLYCKVLRNDQFHNRARIEISDSYVKIGNYSEALKRIKYPFMNQDFEKKIPKKEKNKLLLNAVEISELSEDIESKLSSLISTAFNNNLFFSFFGIFFSKS